MLRRQPRIFVSSSIRGFESQRRAIRDAVEELGLADSWLFEFSATAGAAPASQYLQAARDSDVYVLVATPDVRQGTIDEYGEAFRDSPSKVLPFQIGEHGESTRAFRELLRSRHNVVRVADPTELPMAIANAIRHFVESGAVALPALRELAHDWRRLKREALSIGEVDLPRTWGGGRTRPVSDLLVPDSRAILAGEAGAGKTDAALTALLSLDARLPLFCRAKSSDLSVLAMLDAAFGAARFHPGPALIQQYLRDGTIALVIDELDEVPVQTRDALLRDLDHLAATHPRTAILVLTRALPVHMLSGFEVVQLNALDDETVDQVFVHFDPAAKRVSWRVAPDLVDLVKLPFWCALIAQFGSSGIRGTDLLDRMVASRLNSPAIGDPAKATRLREGLGALAAHIQPASGVPIPAVLDVVANWIGEARDRYSGVAADEIVQAARASGLTVVSEEELRFVHPLLAAFLAGEHAARRPAALSAATSTFSPHAAAFTAALLPDSGESQVASVLAHAGIVAIAALPRVTPPRSRVFAGIPDLVRLDVAGETLRSDHSAHASETRMLIAANLICIAASPARAIDHSDAAIGEWLTEVGTTQAACWKTNPLETRRPEELAAELALAAFKARVVALRPTGSEFGPHSLDIDYEVDAPEFQREIVEFVKVRNAARTSLVEALGLTGELEAPEGEPRVTVTETGAQRYFGVSWGNREPSVIKVVGQSHGESLESIHGDPTAQAYSSIVRELERLLGSPIGSHAVRSPEAPGWSL